MSDMTAAQYPALKTELTNDPKGLGYSTMTGIQAADKLNQVGASNETLGDRKVVETWEVMAAIDTVEWGTRFASFTTAQKEWFDDLVASGKADASSPRVVTGFGTMFPLASAPNSRAALLALVNRSASRGEILFGAGIVVGEHDVIRARAS